MTLIDVVEAMAAALTPIGDTIDGLQVLPYLNQNPTPPSIDIYPATPFQTGSGFGDDKDLFFTVRARTTFADSVAGQQGLYRMLDPAGPESVQAALEADQTLGGTVQSIDVVDEGVSGFTEYIEDAQTSGRLVGCEWRVRVITAADGVAPPVPAELLLLDDFNRANGPLGADWETANVGSAGPLEINGNTVRLLLGNESAQIWTADLFGPDQGVEITITTVDFPNVHVYMLLGVEAAAPAAFTGYLLDIELDAAESILSLYRGNSGGYTTVQTSTGGYGYAAGDSWALRKVGAVLSVLRNGVTVGGVFGSVTDPAPLTGSGYAGFGGRASTLVRFDNFKAGGT